MTGRLCVVTGATRGIGRGAAEALASTFGAKPQKGAETIVNLASSPDVEGVTEKYFVDKRAIASSRESYDEAAARRLWEVSAGLVGL